jgi:hypothetical protein
MDASAEALFDALPYSHTVLGQAVPRAGEVGLIAEYALDRLLAEPDPGAGTAAATIERDTIFAGSDYTALLRYTWLPTAAALANPSLAGPMARVLAALTGPTPCCAAAGPRRPTAACRAGRPGCPSRPGSRSGCSAAITSSTCSPPGTGPSGARTCWWSSTCRVDGAPRPVRGAADHVVRNAVGELADLLPDDSELAIWKFGSSLSHRGLPHRAAAAG